MHHRVDQTFPDGDSDAVLIVLVEAQDPGLAEHQFLGPVDALEGRFEHLLKFVNRRAFFLRHDR
jgi:hypothetical protein